MIKLLSRCLTSVLQEMHDAQECAGDDLLIPSPVPYSLLMDLIAQGMSKFAVNNFEKT